MMPDIASTDIWRAANMMLELYGADAGLRAAMRADALLEQGDTEGFFVWKRIVRAIDDLARPDRKADEQFHYQLVNAVTALGEAETLIRLRGLLPVTAAHLATIDPQQHTKPSLRPQLPRRPRSLRSRV